MRRANHHKARLVVVLNARHSSLNGRVITTLQQLSLFSLLPPTRVARCEYIWLSFSCRCSPCLTINQRRSKEKLIIAFHVCNCHPCSGPLLSGHQCHHQPCRRKQQQGHHPSPFFVSSFLLHLVLLQLLVFVFSWHHSGWTGCCCQSAFGDERHPHPELVMAKVQDKTIFGAECRRLLICCCNKSKTKSGSMLL